MVAIASQCIPVADDLLSVWSLSALQDVTGGYDSQADPAGLHRLTAANWLPTLPQSLIYRESF